MVKECEQNSLCGKIASKKDVEINGAKGISVTIEYPDKDKKYYYAFSKGRNFASLWINVPNKEFDDIISSIQVSDKK